MALQMIIILFYFSCDFLMDPISQAEKYIEARGGGGGNFFFKNKQNQHETNPKN